MKHDINDLCNLTHYCSELECVIVTPIAERDELSVTGYCGHCQSRIVAYIADDGEIRKHLVKDGEITKT
jgi:hypothetical protein